MPRFFRLQIRLTRQGLPRHQHLTVWKDAGIFPDVHLHRIDSRSCWFLLFLRQGFCVSRARPAKNLGCPLADTTSSQKGPRGPRVTEHPPASGLLGVPVAEHNCTCAKTASGKAPATLRWPPRMQNFFSSFPNRKSSLFDRRVPNADSSAALGRRLRRAICLPRRRGG